MTYTDEYIMRKEREDKEYTRERIKQVKEDIEKCRNGTSESVIYDSETEEFYDILAGYEEELYKLLVHAENMGYFIDDIYNEEPER